MATIATALTITPAHPAFAAEIGGVDLTQPLDDATFERVATAFDDHSVLVFRGQALSDAQQMAFSERWGPLETTVRTLGGEDRLGAHIVDLSNTDADGKLMGWDDRRMLYQSGNQLWHSDSSFQKPAARYSMLHSVVIPDKGGETEFADLRAAYDALPTKTKGEIEGLIAEHSIWHSRAQLAVTKYTDEEIKSLPPVPQRVVRTHPGSGRKTLYVAAHASHIIGKPVADGRLLLLDLIEHATQRRFVHSHTWQQGDLVIWDNRCTMHRARPFDTTKVRDLRRVTTRDVASTLEQAA